MHQTPELRPQTTRVVVLEDFHETDQLPVDVDQDLPHLQVCAVQEHPFHQLQLLSACFS